MNVYTVHLRGSPEDPAAVETAVFIREGFSWWALLLGPLWLIWNRLWAALIVWLILEAGIAAVSAFVLSGRWSTAALQALLHFALALESAQVRRSSVARRGYRLADVVHGRQMRDAERIYFGRAGRRAVRSEQPTGSAAFSQREPGMVGLFPSTGA